MDLDNHSLGIEEEKLMPFRRKACAVIRVWHVKGIQMALVRLNVVRSECDMAAFHWVYDLAVTKVDGEIAGGYVHLHGACIQPAHTRAHACAHAPSQQHRVTTS